MFISLLHLRNCTFIFQFYYYIALIFDLYSYNKLKNLIKENFNEKKYIYKFYLVGFFAKILQLFFFTFVLSILLDLEIKESSNSQLFYVGTEMFYIFMDGFYYVLLCFSIIVLSKLKHVINANAEIEYNAVSTKSDLSNISGND